jgi:hypothetical protein
MRNGTTFGSSDSPKTRPSRIAVTEQLRSNHRWAERARGSCWRAIFGILTALASSELDLVVVEDAKVRDYLLSPTHPVGRFKSVFFVALGFSPDRWEELRDALLELARTGDAVPGQVSPFGLKFEIRAIPHGPSGRQATS